MTTTALENATEKQNTRKSAADSGEPISQPQNGEHVGDGHAVPNGEHVGDAHEPARS